MYKIDNLLIDGTGGIDNEEFGKLLIGVAPLSVPEGKVFKMKKDNSMNLQNVPVVYDDNYFSMNELLLSSYIKSLDLYQMGNTPRYETWMNDLGMDYTYGSGNGARTYKPSEWDSLTDLIRILLNVEYDTEYNCCFVNCYKDEQQHLGWHSDDSPEMCDDHPIAIVSFGAEREIWFRKIGETGRAEKGVRLANGSLLVMDAGMQQEWQHRIPKNDKPCGVRLSLTFRKIVNPRPKFKVRFP